MPGTAQPLSASRRAWFEVAALALILALAAALRFWNLGGLSFWYDEVVPVRLARTPNPSALVALLDRIETTRAPLHPLVLQGWVRLFGPSEFAARALSALCGVATVAVVWRLGRRLLDARTGLWAAWLASVSPLLVLYAREAKMYAWLVLLSSLGWLVLESFRRSASTARQAGFVVLLIALGYSQPLGLFMDAALGLGYLARRRDYRLSLRSWLAIQGAALLGMLPWLGRYLDHDPSIFSEAWLSLRYLLGLPIGYVGGNFAALAGCLGLIAWGWLRRERPHVRGVDRFPLTLLLCWLVVPTVLLYAYSVAAHPIFGQARYTLFVGPAYLILLAHGLARLPRRAAVVVALGMALLSAGLLRTLVYDPALKGDWRAGATLIRREDPTGATVLVFSEDPRWSREVEVARYYLGDGFEVLPAAEVDGRPTRGPVWLAVGLRGGQAVARLPEGEGRTYDLQGLRLVRLHEFIKK